MCDRRFVLYRIRKCIDTMEDPIFWGEGWRGDEVVEKFHRVGDINLSRIGWNY